MAGAFAWIETAPEADLALVRGIDAAMVLARLGAVEERGSLSFAEALALQDPEGPESVVQAEVCGDWVVTLEPNGFQAGVQLSTLAAGGDAVSLFWNVNTATELRWRRDGTETAFDPTVEPEDAPAAPAGLPWATEPKAASLAFIAELTGVVLDRTWFDGPKPTFLVRTG